MGAASLDLALSDGSTLDRNQTVTYKINIVNQSKMGLALTNSFAESDDKGNSIRSIFEFAEGDQFLGAQTFVYGGVRNGVPSDRLLYLPTQRSLYRRLEGEETAKAIYEFKSGIRSVVAHPSNFDLVFVLLEDNTIWKSEDTAITWIDITGNLASVAPFNR